MSKIEWTDKTWNPVSGCTKISPGCKNCYAERMAKRLAGRFGYPAAPHEFDVTLREDRLEQPLRWKKPRMVFVCSMSDLFHDDVPNDFIRKVLTIVAMSARHTFQVLTKRPERMLRLLTDQSFLLELIRMHRINALRRGMPDPYPKWNDWAPPRNLWLGVSAESQEMADRRIPLLLKCPAAVRFVSLEPLLGPIDLDEYLVDRLGQEERECRAPWELPLSPAHVTQPGLDWVIVGGESGPGARPMQPSWARDIVQQCAAANVPCFVKQLGSVWAVRTNPFSDRLTNVRQQGDTKGSRMKYWPEDLRIRQYPE